MKRGIFLLSLLLSLSFIAISQGERSDGAKTPRPGNAGASTTTTGGGSTYAVIIGVSKYQYEKSLRFADDDGRYFYDYLRSPAGGAVPAENIIEFYDSAAKSNKITTDLYRKLIKGAAKWPIKAGDRLYIFFSGHGDAKTESNYYLMAHDSRGLGILDQDLMAQVSGAISVKDLKDSYIQAAVSAGIEVIFIIDACRSKDEMKDGATFFDNRKLPNETVIVSTSKGRPSYESDSVGAGQGIFSYYLLNGLYGDADGPLVKDNKVTLQEIKKYVYDSVTTKSFRLFGKESIQEPVVYSAIQENGFTFTSAVDQKAREAWLEGIEQKKKVTALLGSDMAFVHKKDSRSLAEADSVLLELFEQFNEQLVSNRLLGPGSAEEFYDKMKQNWPAHPLTDDAKFSLATELVNFCQQKINLFLSGKGVLHMQKMEEEIKRISNDNIKTSNLSSSYDTSSATTQNPDVKNQPSDSSNIIKNVSEEITKIKRIATTQFDEAAKMIEKAMELLKSDSILIEPIIPKYNFLKAAALSNETSEVKIEEGIKLCREAIRKSPGAAYNYLIMGWLKDAINEDSSLYYYEKTVELAPNWAIAHNSLGNYYDGKDRNKQALQHYKKAVELDSLYTNAYNSIGNIYYFTDKDSAKLYYQKALHADPKFSYASANLGLIYMNEDGDKLLSSKNFKLAEYYLKNAIESDTTYARAYTKLADLYEKTPDKTYRDSSVFYLKKWISINKNSTQQSVMDARSDIYRALADIYLDRSDTVKAGLNQKLAFNVDSSKAESYINLAKFYTSIDRPENAIQIYERGMTKFPRDAAIFNSAGNFYYKNEMSPSAIKYYKKALAIQPASADINYNLSVVYSHLKEYDLAILYNRRAINASPEEASLYHSMGHIYENVNSNSSSDSALSYFRKAALLDPTDNEALSHIGSIYKDAGEYKQALKYFLLALKNDPNDPVKYKNVGTAYYGLKEYDDAEKYFKKSLELDRDNASLYHDLGHLYQRQGKDELAMKSFKTGVQYDPTDLELYRHIATLYANKEEYDEANHYLEMALKVDPKAASIYVAIAENFESMKDLRKAESNYLKAIETNSEYAQAYHGLGHLYFSNGKKETAIDLFKKALEYEEDAETYIEILLHIGDYYLGRGKEYLDEAEIYYGKVLKIDEEHIRTHYSLACVYAGKDSPEQAVDYLRKAFRLSGDEAKKTLLKWCKEDSDLDNIRQHPKFLQLVKEYDK